MSNRDHSGRLLYRFVNLCCAFQYTLMIKGVIYSFTNYNKGYGTTIMSGSGAMLDLFTSSRVGKSYLFTFKYALAERYW